MKYNFLVRIRKFLHGNLVVHLMRWYYNHVWGTNIGKGTRIASSVRLDRTNPSGITIGEYSSLSFDAAVLTHDFVNLVHLPVKIGSYCFIGARVVIMPGVTIGDHCIVGTGSIVMRDVPARSVVIGNPARVIEQNINTTVWGSRIPHPAAAAPSESVVKNGEA